jgi:hypothetical protein
MRIQKIAAPIAAFVLCSCGGGIYNGPGTSSGDGGGSPPINLTGANSPATFAVATDAAMAASLVASLIVPRRPTFPGGACDSGSSTFTPNTSTPYTGDGSRFYDQCVQNVGGEQVIANGFTQDQCNDPASTAQTSSCSKDLVQLGQSSDPITLEGKSSTDDVIERFLGLTSKTQSGSTTTDARAGEYEIENLLSYASLAVDFDQSQPLTISSSPNSDGSKSVSVSGVFGLNDSARSTANCMSGQMTVSTLTPVAVDSLGSYHVGQLHFTSSAGSYGDVTFQSDGSISASVNGGTAQVITKALFDSYCTVQ